MTFVLDRRSRLYNRKKRSEAQYNSFYQRQKWDAHHKRCLAVANGEDTEPLSHKDQTWLSYQLHSKTASQRPQDQIKKLELLIHLIQPTWGEKCGYLEERIKERGGPHCLTGEEMFTDKYGRKVNLTSWVCKQRICMKRNELSKDRIDKLHAISFPWNGAKEDAAERRETKATTLFTGLIPGPAAVTQYYHHGYQHMYPPLPPPPPPAPCYGYPVHYQTPPPQQHLYWPNNTQQHYRPYSHYLLATKVPAKTASHRSSDSKQAASVTLPPATTEVNTSKPVVAVTPGMTQGSNQQQQQQLSHR